MSSTDFKLPEGWITATMPVEVRLSMPKKRRLTLGDTTALAMMLGGPRDSFARKVLIRGHASVVMNVVSNRKTDAPIPGMIQAGKVGLSEAVDKYDPYTCGNFTDFSSSFVRKNIDEFILNYRPESRQDHSAPAMGMN